VANTPLELYENAYRLHFHEKKTGEAAVIYEAIIRTFPDSDECGYAFLQLQKIRASELDGTLKSRSASNPLVMIAFTAGILALVIALGGGMFLLKQISKENRRSTLAVTALSKLFSGDEESALRLLDEMKDASRQDVLAFELSSAIYRRHEQATRAPATEPEPEASVPVAETTAAIVPEPPAAAEKKPAPVKTRRVVKNRKSETGGKSHLIVNPDSLSYF
jgi:hypothetical protein